MGSGVWSFDYSFDVPSGEKLFGRSEYGLVAAFS